MEGGATSEPANDRSTLTVTQELLIREEEAGLASASSVVFCNYKEGN